MMLCVVCLVRSWVPDDRNWQRPDQPELGTSLASYRRRQKRSITGPAVVGSIPIEIGCGVWTPNPVNPVCRAADRRSM